VIEKDYRVVRYHSTKAKKYSFWLTLSSQQYTDRIARKTFIDFVENNLGPLGDRWQYQKVSPTRFILKLSGEQDALLFLLKFKKD
jgi:hypothetical protein